MKLIIFISKLFYTRTFIILILMLLGLPSFGQDSLKTVFPKNTVFLELGGNVSISLNYDRIFYQAHGFKLSYRVGFHVVPHYRTTFLPKTDTITIDLQGNKGIKNYEVRQNSVRWDLPQVVFPLELNLLVGKKTHFLEFGMGYSFGTAVKGVYVPGQQNAINYYRGYVDSFCFRLNYRRQSAKGLFFKAGFMLFTEERFNQSPYIINTNVFNRVGGLHSKWYWLIGIGVGKSF